MPKRLKRPRDPNQLAELVVDFDQEGHIVGLEILNAKVRLGDNFNPSILVAA